jgi:hypothetical protein
MHLNESSLCPYEPTAPKHHWSGWYAAYIVARQDGEGPEEAAKEASKTGDAIGRARWESSFLGLPGAIFFEENHKDRKKEAESKKGGHL